MSYNQPVYRFRGSNGFNVKPQTAGANLERIRNDNNGVLRPRDVVDDARPVEADLHPAFEWDDAKAAELHRVSQASQLIRSVRIISDQPDESEEGPKATIAYVSLRLPEEAKPFYVTCAHAMSDEDMRQQVLSDAIKALESLRSRYGHLVELSEIFRAVDGLVLAVA